MIKRLPNSTARLRSGMVLRFCLIISLVFHAIAFLVFQKAFPLLWVVEELRTYRVELIRPPVEDLDVGDSFETGIAKIKEEDRSGPEGGQETISLDTKEKRYVNYARAIKEKISRHWTYPSEARKNLLEGKLLVVFSLDRQGNLIEMRILENSAHRILDEEAERAIKTASPFPSFPENITVSRLNIKATFDYRLTSKK